jgi:hypothetical protein
MYGVILAEEVWKETSGVRTASDSERINRKLSLLLNGWTIRSLSLAVVTR